jgi:hypothetical protein
MKITDFTGKNLLITAVVLLAVLNITVIATLLINRQEPDNLSEESLNYDPVTDQTSIRYSGRWFREQMGFSNEQMIQFGGFNQSFRQNAAFINMELDRLRIKMLDELAQEEPDIQKLESYSDSIGILHADLKKLTYKYYLSLKSISGEDQRQKLEQLFDGVFAGEGRMRQFRNGPQQGRGRGRQGMVF